MRWPSDGRRGGMLQVDWVMAGTHILPEEGHTKRLLLQRQEDGVDELNEFDVVVDHVVKLQSLQYPKPMRTDA